MAKNDGPTLIDILQGGVNAIPDRLLVFLRIRREKVNIDEHTDVTAISGTTITNNLLQEHTDERQRVTDVIGDLPKTVLDEEVITQYGGEVGTMTHVLTTTPPAINGSLRIVEWVKQLVAPGLWYSRKLEADADWPELNGQEYDEDLDVIVPYTEQIVAPDEGIGDANTIVEPVDQWKSRKIVKVTPVEAYDNYHISFPSYTNLQVPPILQSVTAVWAKDGGDGSSETDFEGISAGTSIHLSGSESGSAHAAATVMPDIHYTLQEVWTHHVPTTSHFFLMPMPVTKADILAKVTAAEGASVIEWPVFKPEAVTFTLKGMKVAVRADASGSASRTLNASTDTSDRTQGGGVSRDVQHVITSLTIPPTLHGSFSLSPTTNAQSCEADAHAEWTGINFPTVDAHFQATAEASGSISPTGITATTPTTIPITGLYVIDSQVDIYKHGYAKVFVEVLDASILA